MDLDNLQDELYEYVYDGHRAIQKLGSALAKIIAVSKGTELEHIHELADECLDLNRECLEKFLDLEEEVDEI